MQLDTIKDELFIYLNDAISEYIGKYDLMLGDISNELDNKYSKGYNLIAESVYEQIKESEVELEKDIKNDLYGTEVYGESEVE